MVTTNGAENSTENITENSTALNPIDTSTLRKKYQLAHTMFCDALLVPETLEAPSSEEEMIECALRVRQVLDIYFKPDLIFTPFVHRHFNTNRNIYYYLEQAENPYVDLELFRYYDYRDMEQISTLAEEFKRLYSGPNNLTKLDPKFISEMEMLEAEVKTTYEKIYASNNDINIVKTRYAKAITNVKGKTADNATDKTSVTSKNNKTDNNKIDSDVDRIENRFKAIKHRSIAYDGAFLKGFHMSLQIAKKANEGHRAFRGLWLLMKFYFAFSKQRRQDLNNLLENPKNDKKSLPAPYRKDVKAILEANNPMPLMIRLKATLKGFDRKFSERAKQFFRFHKTGIDLDILPHDINEKCPAELLRINKQYQDFIRQLQIEELKKTAKYLETKHQMLEGFIYALMVDSCKKSLENDFNYINVGQYLSRLECFAMLYEIEDLMLDALKFYQWNFDRTIQTFTDLRLSADEIKSVMENSAREIATDANKITAAYYADQASTTDSGSWQSARVLEKRYAKEMEAKKREENARKAALELIKKREVLMLKERERKKQEEQQMLTKELEGGFNQLSGTDKKQLADIIQHPRSFHDRLKTADFCALVRQLPRFLLEPTTDGQKLVFNGKPIGGFHREHDKLLDGNVLQSFADVFRDLHVDVSLLTIRPSNAVRSSAKGKDTLDSNF